MNCLCRLWQLTCEVFRCDSHVLIVTAVSFSGPTMPISHLWKTYHRTVTGWRLTVSVCWLDCTFGKPSCVRHCVLLYRPSHFVRRNGRHRLYRVVQKTGLFLDHPVPACNNAKIVVFLRHKSRDTLSEFRRNEIPPFTTNACDFLRIRRFSSSVANYCTRVTNCDMRHIRLS